MLTALLDRQGDGPTEELLKLYWNRADVKREVKALRRERFELLDKLKEQEGAIQRAQEQLEGLERLLTNPLAAANAMVYFQLRHLWRVGAQRLEQFGRELQAQREKRERAQLQDAEMAKRQRRLDAVRRDDDVLRSLPMPRSIAVIHHLGNATVAAGLDPRGHGVVTNFRAGANGARDPRHEHALLRVRGAADDAEAAIDAGMRFAARSRKRGQRRRSPVDAHAAASAREHQARVRK